MANFTPAQPVIDFLVSDDEAGMKSAVEGISPADLANPIYKPLSQYTIYGEADGTMKVFNIVGNIADGSIPDTAYCLSLGNKVTSIGANAFNGCYAAGNLVIPTSVTSIGSYAYYNCSNLEGDLTIPNSVTNIGSYAFYNCSNLGPNLTIPISVTSIGNNAFANCASLNNANIYTTFSVIDVDNTLVFTAITGIHARADDGSWTEGPNQTIGDKAGITVIKDL